MLSLLYFSHCIVVPIVAFLGTDLDQIGSSSHSKRTILLCTRLENGVLRNGQQSGGAVNSFFDQGKFEAMKTLIGWEAARCDEHPFRAKIKVST